MNLPRKELIQEVFSDMQALRRRMSNLGADSHGKTGEITGSQWAMLRLLVHRESMTVKDTAEALDISSSAATQLIDPLVKKGFLTREEGKQDRRIVELRLSSKASQKFKAIRQAHIAQLSDLFEILTDEELAQYVSLNKKLAAVPKK